MFTTANKVFKEARGTWSRCCGCPLDSLRTWQFPSQDGFPPHLGPVPLCISAESLLLCWKASLRPWAELPEGAQDSMGSTINKKGWDRSQCTHTHPAQSQLDNLESCLHHPLRSTVGFSSVAQLCLTLCSPMDCNMPGLPVHHQLPEFTQAYVLRVVDAIQPSHPLSSPSTPTFNLSQHQGLFK